MFNKKRNQPKNNSDLNVQLETIRAQQTVFNTMNNQYGSFNYSNSVY